MKIMTFNLRSDSVLDGKNRWRHRKEIVCDILEKYSYLENINMFINSDSSDNIKEAFLNIVCNAKMDICKIRPIGA